MPKAKPEPVVDITRNSAPLSFGLRVFVPIFCPQDGVLFVQGLGNALQVLVLRADSEFRRADTAVTHGGLDGEYLAVAGPLDVGVIGGPQVTLGGLCY